FAVGCKFWAKDVPSVEVARPVRCPVCAQAGRESSEKRGIHGHGLRTRTVFGVLAVDESPGVHEIELRRYRCLGCGAVLVVGPWDLVPGMLYGLATIVLALAQWTLGSARASVRAQFGAFSVVGVSTRGDWPSLRRWARRAAQGQLLTEVCAQ